MKNSGVRNFRDPCVREREDPSITARASITAYLSPVLIYANESTIRITVCVGLSGLSVNLTEFFTESARNMHNTPTRANTCGFLTTTR